MENDKDIINLNKAHSFEVRFEQIYKEHFDRAFFFAKYIVKSETLAEDIVSEVFISLWKMKSKINEIRDMEAYLFIAVKNQATRKLIEEPKKVDSGSFEITAQFVDRVNPEEVLLEKELTHALEEVVSILPDQCQLIFRMAKNRQMKYQEIADELGISISTVRTQLTKAFAIVRKFLYNRYYESTDKLSDQRNQLHFGTLLLLAQWGIDQLDVL